MARISVIMRTYNRYLFLERAIINITNQLYDNWEIILVNDGGDKEKIQSIFEGLLTKGQYIIINNHENVGLHKAINIGARPAKGEYVVIHDDDDTWESAFLYETVNYLDNNPNCYGVITHTNMVYERVKNNSIKVKRIKPYNYQLRGVISIYDMLRNNLYPPISFIYKKQVFDEIGYFDESLQVLEDWEFNLRFLEKFDIHILEIPLANYHIREERYVLQEAYRNTITGKKAVHEKYDTVIRNKYLRNDLYNREIGLGVLMNIIKLTDGKVLKILKRILKNTFNKKSYQLQKRSTAYSKDSAM